MGEIVRGAITDITDNGRIIISAPIPNYERFVKRKSESVLIEILDGRTISPKQRKKAHALIGEIAEWSGDTPEWIKRHMKIEFMADRLQSLEKKIFSLSDADVTTVREFISFLIDFILRFDVPTRVPLYELCEDIERYLFSVLIHKKCAVCGRKAELHHAEDRIGMGRDRKTIIHEGMRVMSLCREHHIECHSISQNDFNEKYHMFGISATKEICKKWGLKHAAD